MRKSVRKIAGKTLLILNVLAAVSLLLANLSPFINPEHLVFPAFFGLAYPYILLLNLLFLAYWVTRLRKEFILSLVVILLGWNHLQNLLPFRFSAAQQNDVPAGSIRFMSYNVRAFDLYNWTRKENSRNDIFDLIENEDPDVLCLQEFYTSERQGQKESDIAQILGDYPHSYLYYGLKSSENAGFGIATYSKFPILRTSRIPFNETFNQAFYADLLVDRDTIRVFNIHLQSIRFGQQNYEFLDSLTLKYSNRQLEEMLRISNQLSTAYKRRAEQAKIIQRYIEASPHPVVVCGDFNDTPVSYAYFRIKRGLKDAFRTAGRGFGNTYAGELPSFRIDYILYSEEFDAGDFRRLKSKFSDHFPVMASIWIDGQTD